LDINAGYRYINTKHADNENISFQGPVDGLSYSYAGEGERAVELVSESGSTSYSSVRVHQLKSIGLE